MIAGRTVRVRSVRVMRELGVRMMGQAELGEQKRRPDLTKDHTDAIAALRKHQEYLHADEVQQRDFYRRHTSEATDALGRANKYAEERQRIGDTIEALGGKPYEPPPTDKYEPPLENGANDGDFGGAQ